MYSLVFALMDSLAYKPVSLMLSFLQEELFISLVVEWGWTLSDKLIPTTLLMVIRALIIHVCNMNPTKQDHEDMTTQLGEACSLLCPQRSWSSSPGHSESLLRHHHIILRSDLCPSHATNRGSWKTHFPSLSSTYSLFHMAGPHCWLHTEILLILTCSGVRAPPLHALTSLLWGVVCRVIPHTRQKVQQHPSPLPGVTNTQLIDQSDPVMYVLQIVSFVGKVQVSWNLSF